MLTTDPAPETPARAASVDDTVAPEPKRSGRRAAVAAVDAARSAASVAGGAGSRSAHAAPVVEVPTAGRIPTAGSRRALRAAREAAAATELSALAAAARVDDAVAAPVSPTLITAALPVVAADAPAAVAPVVAVTPIVIPAAVEVVPEGESAAVVPAALAPVEQAPAAEAPRVTTAPLPLAGLAASIPSSVVAGRRETFVPAAVSVGRPPLRKVGSRASVRPESTTPARSRGTRLAHHARRFAIVGVVCGILATSVLPVLKTVSSSAYAEGSTEAYVVPGGSQTYDVATGVTNTVSNRDSYGATSVVDYEGAAIAARQKLGIYTWTGPTAADYLAKPKYTTLDRAEVFQVALQYLGTPYVHGGDTPGSFDCSGFIMYVYAQFGISLPHYVPSQDAAGTTIPQSEAVPGDLVVFDNDDHDGFYAGNGMIMDAPKPGGYISVRPIWDSPHHFVRIG